VNQVFIRSEQLADKIHEIKLLMPEWKVLFSLDGKMTADEIAVFLEMNPNQVENSVQRLQELGLVQQSGQESGPAVPDSGEATEETISDFLTEEPEVTFPESTETDEMTPESGSESPMPEFMEESQTSEEMEEPKETEEMTEAKTISEELSEDSSPPGEDEISLGGFDEEVSEEVSEEEHLEELNLEEESVQTEEETEEDLDSLINDLLKEEASTDESSEGPKILDEEEIANLDEKIDLPQESFSTESEDQVTETEKLDLDSEFESSVAEPVTDEVEEEAESVEIPQEVTETAEEAVEEVTTAPSSGEGHKTILVVDDSIVIRKMVEIALENESYEVVSVATGKDAFSYLDSKNPDLVILDIMLPDVNGLDILKAIKASKTIPVVMLSAKDTPKETSQAKDLGADDFIPKPFRDEELVSKIHELIGQ